MNRPRKRPAQGKRTPRVREASAPPAAEALEASGLAWWEFDVRDGHVRLSGLWNEMVGGERKPLAARAEELFALVPEEDRPAVAAVFYGALKGERAEYQVEHRVRTRAGEYIWVRAMGQVVERTADGRTLRLTGTVREITREMQGRQALARSEARFRQLTQIYSDWFWELDEELRFSHIEGRGLEKIGITPAEAIGKRSLEFANYRLISMRRDEFDELRRRREPYRDVLACFDLPDGSRRFVSVTGEPIFDADGAFRGYRGVTRDITGRMRAEETLRQSEARFKGAFEDSAIGMAINSPEGRLLQVNRALCNMLGFTREELRGKSFQDITHPDDLALNLELYRESLAGKRDSYQMDKRYLRKNGEPVWIQLNVSLVRDAEGKPLQFVTQIQDISARRAAQQAAEHLALHDALTGLANSRLLPDRIEQAIAAARRAGTKVGVVFVDLDGFKPVNDRLGHAAGDHLLREIGRRLKAALREGDTVARTGGDEFAAVVTGCAQRQEFVLVAQRLLEQVALPCAIGSDTAQVSASLGIALYPDDADQPAELLRLADAAMYESKRSAKGGFRFAQGAPETS